MEICPHRQRDFRHHTSQGMLLDCHNTVYSVTFGLELNELTCLVSEGLEEHLPGLHFGTKSCVAESNAHSCKVHSISNTMSNAIQGNFYELVPWSGEVDWDVSPWGYWFVHAQTDSYEAELTVTVDPSSGTPLRYMAHDTMH